MANLDNLNSFATANRLLWLVYDHEFIHKVNVHFPSITSLTLDICGIEGTHGSRDWHGMTGSIGMVRCWRRILEAMPNLQQLDVRAVNTPPDHAFQGDLSHSDRF